VLSWHVRRCCRPSFNQVQYCVCTLDQWCIHFDQFFPKLQMKLLWPPSIRILRNALTFTFPLPLQKRSS
jgi:hypothetical protein